MPGISPDDLQYAGAEVRVKNGDVILLAAYKVDHVAPTLLDARDTGRLMLKQYATSTPSKDRVGMLQRMLGVHQQFAASVRDAVQGVTDYSGPIAVVHEHLAELERHTNPGRKYTGRHNKRRKK